LGGDDHIRWGKRKESMICLKEKKPSGLEWGQRPITEAQKDLPQSDRTRKSRGLPQRGSSISSFTTKKERGAQGTLKKGGSFEKDRKKKHLA